MSNASIVFLAVRILHVLLAAAWLGATAFMYLLLDPALKDIGPAESGPVVAALGRRRIAPVVASIGGVAVVSGIWLYWRFTGHFDPALSGTMAARVFGTGGAAGVLALILSGRAWRRRSKSLGLIVLIFQIVALALMTIGHYV
jgi:uncharacterized membrane protein